MVDFSINSFTDYYRINNTSCHIIFGRSAHLSHDLNMYILGISCYYHDSAAALIKDGVVVAASQEERFTRKKHDLSFPVNAINYCLKSQGITIEEIDYVAFYEKPILKFERVLSQCLDNFPGSLKIFLRSMPSWITEKLRVEKTLKKKFKYEGDIFFIDHHLSHASSFLVSPFSESAIVIADGVGEWATTSYGIGKDNELNLIKEIHFPHSLGLLYSTITAYLGFTPNNSEGTVMALNSYGEQDKVKNEYYQKLKKTVKLRDSGGFSLNMDYFSYHYTNIMPSKKLYSLLGGPIRKRSDKIDKRHMDIAAALQMLYEETLFNMLNFVQKETNQENLVFSGGCALNSVANGKILKETNFKNIWIPSDPGDGGTGIGAAIYAYNKILGQKRNFVMENAYLGPDFTNKEIGRFLDENNIKNSFFEKKEDFLEEVVKLINEGNTVGWFQGRMEWGPRALGSRSILANPCNSEMKERINMEIKHRESFRPFAPAVCIDDVDEYFECDNPIPLPLDFMAMVYPIKERWRQKISSVVHIDGSGRLQTVKREENEDFYDLIKRFGNVNGIPILLNTSFNIAGEPIVCTPDDAYNCMKKTGLDALVMGRFLIKKL